MIICNSNKYRWICPIKVGEQLCVPQQGYKQKLLFKMTEIQEKACFSRFRCDKHAYTH